MNAARLISLAASVLMLGFAYALLFVTERTLQDTATKLAAIFAGGLMGLYCFGFLTKWGDGRAVFMGILFTVAFSAWLALVELKVITPFVPFETYYGGLVGNVIMFLLGCFFGGLVFRPKRDLTNLTVWTQTAEWKALDH